MNAFNEEISLIKFNKIKKERDLLIKQINYKLDELASLGLGTREYYINILKSESLLKKDN